MKYLIVFNNIYSMFIIKMVFEVDVKIKIEILIVMCIVMNINF